MTEKNAYSIVTKKGFDWLENGIDCIECMPSADVMKLSDVRIVNIGRTTMVVILTKNVDGIKTKHLIQTIIAVGERIDK